MPTYETGQNVFVPAHRLKGSSQDFALIERRVEGVDQRSVWVADGDNGTVRIGSRLVHSSALGFLVLRIGDFDSEPSLLDPLAKSVLHFMKLLLTDDCIHYVSVRTLDEVALWWAKNASKVSHVILIGHGSSNGISFLSPADPVLAKNFADVLIKANRMELSKIFISLSCSTGQTGFGRPFSQSLVCKEFMAPIKSVHGALASQFAQSYLAHHLLRGREAGVAHRLASESTAGLAQFDRWVDGKAQKVKTARR